LGAFFSSFSPWLSSIIQGLIMRVTFQQITPVRDVYF
jgi:hypothetical protein